MFCLSVAYFKGKSDTGPPKKKKKCKKKNFKERGADEKTPTPKSQQKPSASTQKALNGPAKLNGPKTQTINASTPQTPKGKISTPSLSDCALSVLPPVRGLQFVCYLTILTHLLCITSSFPAIKDFIVFFLKEEM